MRLVRGLAISDFWMAINFLSSASMNLSGNNIGSPKQKDFCSFNGFMIQVFVVQSKPFPILPPPPSVCPMPFIPSIYPNPV